MIKILNADDTDFTDDADFINISVIRFIRQIRVLISKIFIRDIRPTVAFALKNPFSAFIIFSFE
jgi:hypothetical protein